MPHSGSARFVERPDDPVTMFVLVLGALVKDLAELGLTSSISLACHRRAMVSEHAMSLNSCAS